VAAIQLDAAGPNTPVNRARVQDLMQRAARAGARFVVLPEMTLAGPAGARTPQELHPESIPGPTTEFFAQASRSLHIWTAFGLPEDDGHSGFYSSLVLMSPSGTIEWIHRKDIVRRDAEDGAATRGNFRALQETVDAGGFRVGIMAGDDIRIGIPRLADRGADIILVPAVWPASDSHDWTDLCKSYAREYGLAVAVANRGPGAGSAVYLAGGRTAEVVDSIAMANIAIQRPRWTYPSSLGLPPTIPGPNYEPGSPELAELGRELFFDPNLSSTGAVSCGTCHQPGKAFTNAQPKGTGVLGRTTKRNVPSILNVAFRPVLQWDGYASTLENFAKYPISGTQEMNFHYLDDVPKYVNSRPDYAEAFRRTLHIDHVEFPHVARALAVYERTLISANSPFDRYYYGRDRSALTESAKHGLQVFTGKGGCVRCHVIGDRYSLLLDYKYHVLGVGYNTATARFDDIGLAGISTDDQKGLFQTPSLRNVADTAPYMHDGSFTTLESVIEFYDRGGIPNPQLDPAIRPLHLTAQEKADLIDFLKSLSGQQHYEAAKPANAVAARR
jgi:cytochrome c peroxidase